MVDPGSPPEDDRLPAPTVAGQDPPGEAGGGLSGRARSRPPRRGILVGAVAVAVAVVAVSVAVGVSGRIADGPRPSTFSAAGRTDPRIVAVGPDGALSTVDGSGRQTTLAAESGAAFAFPAWSPDGSRVAVIEDGSAIAIYPVPDGPAASAGSPADTAPATPTVIYRSSANPPFYLYWTPDGRSVSFLTTEGDEVALRVAAADGSAPLDGSGPGAVLRRGAPLYFDWIANDRLLLHVGDGETAFGGEVGLDGTAAAPSFDASGSFRSAVVGTNGRFRAWVRGIGADASIVVAARDGSAEHVVRVFGPAAAVFDPSGATVATIGGETPAASNVGFPLGPLRLVDAASGSVRTLLDGSVLGFFWSPDGRTIAALRLQRPSGGTTADLDAAARAGGLVSMMARSGSVGTMGGDGIIAPTRERVIPAAVITAADPSPAPTTPTGTELHVLFVDVVTGNVRSDRVVELGGAFVSQFLPYFDQYALSHRVWSPDSRSLLLPLIDAAGRVQLTTLMSDGTRGPAPIDAVSGFWSP